VAVGKVSEAWRVSTNARCGMDDKIERKANMFPVGQKAGYLRATEGRASPRTAIKIFCVECMGYNMADAKDCVTVECPLFRYMKRDNKGI
jgi:hypothetical protein